MNLREFTARVRAQRQRGEELHHAVVMMPGLGERPARVFRAMDCPTENGARLEVLEWAQRHGKVESLRWE